MPCTSVFLSSLNSRGPQGDLFGVSLAGICVTRFGFSVWRQALLTWLCFNHRNLIHKFQFHQHLALITQSGKILKMSPAFSNNNNCGTIANSVNTTAPDDRSEILAWLSPLEPRVRHRDIGARRVDSIGAWLLETEEFRRWNKGRREDGSYYPTLFCDGNPGVGKSYIMYVRMYCCGKPKNTIADYDDSSLVIDKLCDEAIEGDPTVVCFYFNFALRNEQSPVNMLGSLLRQLVSGQGEIPEVIAQAFRKEKMSIGGRGLQISGILKIFNEIATTRHIIICVDALDECVPEDRMVILESLGQILQGSPNTCLFITGRPHVRRQVEKELGGATTFIFIRATEDRVSRFLREKLRKDTMPKMMSSTLEGDIMNSIPAISSETYV